MITGSKERYKKDPAKLPIPAIFDPSSQPRRRNMSTSNREAKKLTKELPSDDVDIICGILGRSRPGDYVDRYELLLNMF